MELRIPIYTAVRWMVHDWDGALRGFHSKADAEKFVANRDEFSIHYIPKTFKTIKIEEAPF
mgnify:FL=1